MAKSQTAWTTAKKSTDIWVGVGKNTTNWGNESPAFPNSWAYNAPGVTYNNAGYTYNYVTLPPANQTNNKTTTPWSAS